MEAKRALYAFVVGISLTAATAAGKSFIDVERLKTQVETMIDLIKETRDDIRDVKKYLLTRREKND